MIMPRNTYTLFVNVRFRWKAGVGECLLYTESGRSGVN